MKTNLEMERKKLQTEVTNSLMKFKQFWEKPVKELKLFFGKDERTFFIFKWPCLNANQSKRALRFKKKYIN